MEIIDFNSHIDAECALTTGNFDGVHNGHIKLLETLNDISTKNNYKRALLTFDRHPRLFFNSDLSHYVLSPFFEKTELLSDKVDYIIPIHFDADFAAIKPRDYMLHLLQHFNMRHYIAGYDHHIGRGKDGSFDKLLTLAKEYQFDLDQVKPVIYHGAPISSSRIKNCLQTGDADNATAMLGRPYALEGTVIKGRQLGRTIKFPTANIDLPNDKYIPPMGVYASFIYYKDSRYSAMLNIGTNPTITNNSALSVEAHLINFSEDIYGKQIRIEIISKIRDEKKFENITLLQEQLIKDRGIILNILNQI